MRVIMLYFACFELAPKDKNTLLKSLQKEQYREILQNMEFLDSSIAQATKFRRKHPIMTAAELQEFSLRNQKAAFKIVKCEPKICKLIKQMHNGQLDPREYPYMGE